MKKIGILGGGQLALMMLPSIKSLGFSSVILDQANASTESLADEFVVGDFSKKEDCLKLSNCDVVTFEIENVSLEGLKELSKNTEVHPSPKVLETIQDKGKQKQFFRDIDVPTSDFSLVKMNNNLELKDKVVKLRTGGYDGKGVWVPNGDKAPDVFLNQECLVEDKVRIKKEVAIVCSRNISGEIVTYELVEMVMDPELNLLDYQVNPSKIDPSIQKKAKDIAEKIIAELGHVGTLAVEFFIDLEEKLWVNELAPRVHNSGHNTLESAPCSQFENHIRSISGLPLGETSPSKASLTMNLIGEGNKGPTNIVIPEDLADKAFFHLYNKKECRPGRKMGHVTLLGSEEEVLKLKNRIKNEVKITGGDL